jgi:hypothetical protein
MIVTLTYLVKHVLQLVLRQSRALDVFDRTKLPRHSLSILPLYRCHSLL